MRLPDVSVTRSVVGAPEAHTHLQRAWPPRRRLFIVRCGLIIIWAFSLCLDTVVWAQNPPPPPPPAPSATSKPGDTVTNPITGLTTTVIQPRLDPKGSPTEGALEFVKTADGYAFLVKTVGQYIYNDDLPTPQAYRIVSIDTTTNTAQIDPDPPGPDPLPPGAPPNTPPNVATQPLSTRLLYSTLQSQVLGAPPAPPTPPTPNISAGAGGVDYVVPGANGSNGRPGAVFVPPTSGGDGSPGPSFDYTNTTVVSATNRPGVVVGSVGGNGGKGGDSYLSFWSARDGGNGGAGGSFTFTNDAQVAASGTDSYGIFAFSKSGKAGDGGSGYAAVGGGTGGHSSDAGSVTVTNNSTVITHGEGAAGIYGLSVSNNGGNGGSQWGLVGQAGSASFGGSGGPVSITNSRTGNIDTNGNLAHGIFAQSIGGSGGSSGTAGNLLVSLIEKSDDNGGHGGSVTVTNDGVITTRGLQSRGIFAQSIGGAGGSDAGSYGLIALGGVGSKGGNGGSVTVSNHGFGTITTEGVRSDGIFAQSVGGSGGSGSNTGGLVAIGGSGGNAGTGGTVTVQNYGTILTKGDSSRAIFAQSVGGGGGDGGSSGGMVAVGGSGAGGGRSSTVSVTQGGSITTQGADSAGIFAQSVGGGGGNGGSSGSVGLFAGVAIGGTGGGGGQGGDVNLSFQGKSGAASTVHTEGIRSTGVFAQSVGGGGGNGGGAVQVTGGIGAGVSVGVGGKGGNGGAGGTVTVTNLGGISSIQTDKDDSAGMVLQSVGGGGGNGGYAVSVAVSGGPISGSAGIALGGKGGLGGDGGTVSAGDINTAGFSGSIVTNGERSPGLVAQSVGGGGGNGGLSVAAAGSGSLVASGSVGISLGGSAGGGGNGGTVSIGTQGDITTKDSHSTALLVQSVGGGGGNGGSSVAATLSASGGTGGSVSVGLGGSGGGGGTGGAVSAATKAGTISTEGNQSSAIVLQSVGGGGGNGGFTVSAADATSGATAGAISVGLGGSGGSGGKGGTVNGNFQTNITTTGPSSTGILAQSVGGGGGNGGMNISAAGAGAGGVAGGITAGLGGTGGSGGIGDRVDVSSTGTITTEQDRSAGLVAQSIGGGGGNGGFNVSASGAAAGGGSAAVSFGLGGSAGTGNDGGVVVASTSGAVTTGGDQSIGILAQSVGGGGGNGGFNVSASGAVAAGGAGAVSVGLGGSGAAGGKGDSVTLTVRNNVGTDGNASSAVVAQSIGGGGGNGGFNVSANVAGAGIGSGAIDVGLGGKGGSGGTGGVASATVTGNIETTGSQSNGILVQSLGGGGGNGGFNVTAAGAGAGVGSGAISVGIGGKGNSGGNSSVASLTAIGNVTTEERESRGIVVQSIAGGGGNGGLLVDASAAGAGIGSGAISVGVGGSGAAGGNVTGKVTANVQGNITTSGQNADGFVAQSIGGGGGNGALNVTAALSGAGTGSGAVSVGVGGSGGKGGNANVVDADYSGALKTEGDNATAFLAQAIGGGGGSAGGTISAAGSGAGVGSGSVSVGVGGSGGAGGNGGADTVDLAVTADAGGSIDTSGRNAAAFVAQSIGGGGGNGGYTVSANASFAGVGSGSVAVGIGGAGAHGGDGKEVQGNVTARVQTHGDNSTGVLVQSVGGGGGNGGFDVTVAGSGAGTGSGAVSVGLGGKGDVGGSAGKVTATSTNAITTDGDRSSAFVAQSIAGGGGNGGFNVTVGVSGAGTGSGAVSLGLGGSGAGGGTAGSVTASTTAKIETLGNMSAGILAQSIGGGGGNGGFDVNVALSGAGTGSGAVGVGLGGSAAGGANASTVDLTVRNDVKTSGRYSGAVTAQSIGGGGGNGGFDVNVAGSVANGGSGAVGVGLGGSAGGGGDGARVNSDMTGNITTLDDHSTGLLVQSVGGGGGNGGFNFNVALSAGGTGSGAASVGIGGSGGSGGKAGNVTSTLKGDVETSGSYSTGVTAQSIGGGGGNGGFDVSGAINSGQSLSGGVSVGIGGSGGGGGLGGVVENTVTGDVTTSGRNAGGVLAQSVGGGGGAGGFNVSGAIALSKTNSGAISVGVGGSGGLGGAAGSVTNTVTGDVKTSDTDAFGILAQSVGGGGGNGGLNVSGSLSVASNSAAGAIAVGVGGAGGKGGDASSVNNTVKGYVQTEGNRSAGISTESIGGGGGHGGVDVAGTITGAMTGSSGGLAVGVGGLGGDGGNGFNATSDVTGGVLTTGNSSAGIVTQSIGGGGGNGGLNVTGAINLSKENGGVLGFGIGGFGGDGGNAGIVSSTITATQVFKSIETQGVDSSAVIAQSIGGGGGTGGINVTGDVNVTGKSGAAIGIGVGGFGGGAGHADDVTVKAKTDITTNGNNSNGLIAESIGGGGGTGGINVTGSLSIIAPSGNAAGTSVDAAIGVGGFGGDGGRAGRVDVDYTGTIMAVPETHGDTGSHGIAARSIGGGGGEGGVNVSGGIGGNAGLFYKSQNANGRALLIGVGGFGGGGGNAGDVDVKATGTSITAYGNGRSAILASSVGGGGGSGGLNVSGSLSTDSPLIVGVGGMGGDGGTGGNVVVHATNDLFTGAQPNNDAKDNKDKAGAGLMAQSIGGGGGDGGLNVSGGITYTTDKNVPSITFGIGGFGGAGAISGNVSATHTGTISTTGGWTHGIFAQSIAGGGGNGALNVTGEINYADSHKNGGKSDLAIVAGIGGHGGEGANAGNVDVTSNGGTITTAGNSSRGIFAQTIGGGGGTGGMNVTGVFTSKSSPVMLGIGGFGSGGGDAGSVVVAHGTKTTPTGKITTDGKGAIGIEASSVGGGGGDAGMDFMLGISTATGDTSGGGSGGGSGSPREHPQNTGVDDAVFTNYDKVLDQLEKKQQKDSEDTKDANKDSAFAVQIAVGGAGGEAGNGGAATVRNYSDIETKASDSHGILAQSIGGGGGNATLNLGVVYEGSSDKNKGFNVAIGGAPGDGGTGSKVEVEHQGTIETHGNNSYGVLAQSVGGGGGNVGLDVAYSKTDGGKIGISIGRTGGTGGSAGDVSLTSKGDITTHGDTSYGLLAQSIGNGGGNSSANGVSIDGPVDDKKKEEKDKAPQRSLMVSVGLEGGHGGFAGNVKLEATGSVTTYGENSHAIFAQSVGGGGGNGGSATGIPISNSAAALLVGGAGGEGGTGGNVDVTSSAQVRTHNNRSVGILAQSVGGAGGTGGGVTAIGTGAKLIGALDLEKGSAAVISIGGSGGTGMSAGNVTVGNSGIVITEGDGSHGVLAQSVGGGGGNAGLLVNLIDNKDAQEATQLNVSVGGSGGTGARSGNVTVTNTGGVGTSKDNSIGLFAQSIGGGGGNANSVVIGAFSQKGAGNKINVGIGGSGGTGGAAGDVTVSNHKSDAGTGGQVITLGDYSHGILAMSVGGGGGTGSMVITNSVSLAVGNGKPASVDFSLGGAGGTGGTGGAVLVDNAGAITTYGYKAHGIVAESIGGGGGAGGIAIASDLTLGGAKTGDGTKTTDATASTISVGGAGGSGNRGGNVTVKNSGTIEVHGEKAFGIYAQSVGGGGGDGGFAASLSPTLLTDPRGLKSLLNFAVGGRGATGGDAGDVLVQHSGTITSFGDNSYGIFAQSVGGGGGRNAIAISSPLWTASELAFNAIVGGDGSSGHAGKVTVNTTGNIKMFGANSQAQFTQAVSGGGGDLDLFLNMSQTAISQGKGGFVLPDNGGIVEHATALVTMGASKVTGAIGSAIDATHVGDLFTGGNNSAASNTQSIGGGGGNAGGTVVVDEGTKVDLELALGAKEVSNSSGGDVTLNRSGSVQTAGNQSQGVSVQSIGGGGGRAAVDVQTASSRTVTPASNASATVGLGADPSFGNNGGNLDLRLSGTTVTAGDYSPGLVLQSIGAGGGQAYLSGLKNATINIGAADGSSGDGGNIHLSNTGAIATFGELSDGIVLQSIGGGGGYVITDVKPGDVKVNARSNNSGNGGNISFTQTGDIVVFGDRSRGVVAQSVGGGGGFVDGVFSGSAGGNGTGGAIDLHLGGDVLATGHKSTAIVAQSVGTGAANITIDLAPNAKVIGGVEGIGVALAGGAKNSVLNRGLLTTMSGIDGLAITGTNGNTSVDNFGTISGSIDLGTGVNNLINRSGAWLSSGSTLNLGAGTFTNSGTFDPGGGGRMQRTNLTGSFVQSGTPTWFVDIGEVGNSDGLFASGRADLGNSVTTVNLHETTTPLGSGAYTLLATSGGLSGAQFKFGTMAGAMPIGQTFTLDVTDTALNLNLKPSTGTFLWNGAVSGFWSDPFVNGVSNWTRGAGKEHIFGTPGALSDVVFEGNATTALGANFTIGSLAGTGNVFLGGKSLTTGETGLSTTWAGTLFGSGSLTKTGSGVFTLTGINVFDGPTTVAGGQMLVHGFLGGTGIRVLSGALLGGNGVVPAATIANGGVLAPGASIGTLTVNGDLTFEPGSTYNVETTGAGLSDLTWANGSVLGSGATLRVQPGGAERYHPITMYGVLRAQNAKPGIFSNAVSDASYLNPSLQFDSNGMYLTLRRNDVDFRSTGTRGNQSAVAVALNGLVRTATGEMAGVINNVYDLSNDKAVRAIGSMTGVLHQDVALTSLSGAQTFMDVTMSRVGDTAARASASSAALAFNTPSGAISSAPNQGAWLIGVGTHTRYGGTAADPAARVSSPGFAVGFDTAIGSHVTVGGSGAQFSPDLELEGVDDRASSRMVLGGAYARYQQRASRLSVTAGGSSVSNNTLRSVTDGVALSGAHAAYDNTNLFSRIEYGYTFWSGKSFQVEPRVGFQYIRVNFDGFTEEGARVLNLETSARSVSSQRSILGGRAARMFGSPNTGTTVEMRAAWAHEFSPLGSMRMRLAGDTADNAFDVTSPARIHNSAVVGGSVVGKAFKRVKFVTSVDGDLSSVIKLWNASIGLRAEW